MRFDLFKVAFRAGLLAVAMLSVPGIGMPGANAAELDKDNALVMTLKGGEVIIKLRPDLAPKHVERVKLLTRAGFYDGLKFHRVLTGFMAQTGDPRGDGTGGSTHPDLPAEFTRAPFGRGTIGAARTMNPDSANSQFFICFGDGCAHLQGQYTVWGEVVEGMELVDKIKQGSPSQNGSVQDPDKIEKLQVLADVK